MALYRMLNVPRSSGLVRVMGVEMAVGVLPQAVVDMIAAGEVIERPASVVKELMENSLDAGATRIDVLVENGGKDRIAVADDGSGMDAADLAIAVLSHATSKLFCAEDLFRVTTFGFRGEALPSIGAVSMMEIRSRARGSDEGSVVSVDGGRIQGPAPAGCPPGTSVDVKNLFFNAPVRRKFFRNTPTEMFHVSAQVMNAALARPDVSFSLAHGRRTVWQLEPVEDLRDRIESFFGAPLARDLVPVSYSEVGLTVSGFVAPPPHGRSNRNSVFTYINGRYVREKTLLHAVSLACREFLPQGRHPVAFLFLSLDPSEVDVNVHPTKLDVRFRRSGQMHGILTALFRSALEKGARAVRIPVADQAVFGETPWDDTQGAAGGEGFLEGVAPAAEGAQKAAGGWMRGPAERADRGGRPPSESDPFRRPAGAVAAGRPPAAWTEPREEQKPNQPAGPAPARAFQVHDSYIVVETEGGIEIIDQHALHERILYEEISARISGEGLSMQKLLIPMTVDLGPAAEAALAEAAPVMLRFGVEVEPFGPGSLAVHGIPPFLPDGEVEGFVRDVADELSGMGGAGQGGRSLDAVAKKLACRSAVKAGQVLASSTIRMLVERASAMKGPPTCPHGRPAVLAITLKDLERHFRRT